ncbi:hypothetical protein KUTG_06653 [Kutzneria sp. 744]|nr:hypothetical protein KUTG_06653 [Kutzneria sp. 744]
MEAALTTDYQVGQQQSLHLLISLHRLLRTIRQAAPAGLYPTQLIVLNQLLQGGPMRVGELAAQVPCSHPPRPPWSATWRRWAWWPASPTRPTAGPSRSC